MGYISAEAVVPGPSIADLEGDGDFEAVWSQVDILSEPNELFIFNARELSGLNVTGFPAEPEGEQYNGGHQTKLPGSRAVGEQETPPPVSVITLLRA